MSFKQEAELRKYIDKDGVEQIRDIVLKNVRFNYTYLESPRDPLNPGGTPTYETNLIIDDKETWAAFEEYFTTVYGKAVAGAWGGRKPNIAAINVPFYVPTPDDNGEPKKFEENAIAIIKTRTTQQPRLFVRLPGENLREATAEDEGAFYSGMIGEAVISLWAYAKGNYSPKDGIKAFINAVCKTDNGEPIVRAETNYFEAFGGSEDNEDNIVTAFSSPKQPPKKATQQVQDTSPAKQSTGKASILGDLMSQTAEPIQAEETPVAAKTTLADLLKKV